MAKEWIFMLFTEPVETLRGRGGTGHSGTIRGIYARSQQSSMLIGDCDVSTEQLESMLLDGLLEQWAVMGHRLPAPMLPWLLYAMCWHANDRLAFRAWRVFEQMAPHYRDFMLSTVDLVRVSSIEALPSGIGYLLKAYPLLVRHQTPAMIRRHFSLLLRIALDARAVQWRASIRHCIIAMLVELQGSEDAHNEIEHLFDDLIASHDFTPVLPALLDILPMTSSILLRLRTQLACYYLSRAMDISMPGLDTLDLAPCDDQHADPFMAQLVAAIDRHWMNGTPLSDFDQMEVKLKLVDYTLDLDTINDASKWSIRPCRWSEVE
ncbi:hypothetical protein SYNPS1DRAFT_29829 [Syncephalis pseudoplumigaleata]|uniref:Uncharacterized protein n=1 Tax=Syncephalis pseudoplumigaleata TaxID=1712513 RepID=A0A4P9YWU8_9FUNG|nr:hypothetical protein SYNPS1DRAFT_29829 [Syncephalis pseudoplumigaleata]|eukprot:RKP24404.1 hypothetical protein SYNPS1DRAFT_29829 [Syncephalis pseudoplumigaleata]